MQKIVYAKNLRIPLFHDTFKETCLIPPWYKPKIFKDENTKKSRYFSYASTIYFAITKTFHIHERQEFLLSCSISQQFSEKSKCICRTTSEKPVVREFHIKSFHRPSGESINCLFKTKDLMFMFTLNFIQMIRNQTDNHPEPKLNRY